MFVQGLLKKGARARGTLPRLPASVFPFTPYRSGILHRQPLVTPEEKCFSPRCQEIWVPVPSLPRKPGLP